MSFASKEYLWLLLVIPAGMAVFFWWSGRVRQHLMTQFIQARLLPGLIAGVSTQREKVRAAALILAAVCLLLALARPQWGYDLEEVSQRGLDIVVAIDTSKSMLAEDITPNRLERAKLAALDLMQQAKADRMGLVAFAGTAFLQCPLTFDDTAFEQSIRSLTVNTLPQGGTDLADAIETAQTAFKEGEGYKVLVLFTDGEDHDPNAMDATQKAAAAGLRIFTIGIGTKEGQLLNPKLVRDENGNAVKSHLNEELLQQIAGAANGFYLPLRGANTIDMLYQRGLAPLPKTESQERWLKRAHERYHWPLAIAIMLLIADMFFPERQARARRGQGKTSNLAPSTSNLPSSAAVLMAFLGLPAAIHASPASALSDYQSGNFTNALAEYSKLAEVRTNDLRLVFNAGDAAYRATNFDLAQKLFEQATASQDLKLQQQAYYNLGNVQFQKAGQAKDLDGLEQGFEAAATIYAQAVKLNTNDADAVFNLNYAKNAAEYIRQIKAALARGKSSADLAVRRAEFHNAYQIMQELTQKYQIAAEQFKEFTTKLKNIDDIANPPHQP